MSAVNARETPPRSANGNGTARSNTDTGHEKSAERDALKLLIAQLDQLREYASLFVTARIDSAKASIRSAILGLILAAFGAVAVTSLVVTASVFVLSGVAQGLGRLFGDHPWIGTLLTGLVTLTGIGIGALGAIAARRNRDLKKAVEKYGARRAKQRVQFGDDSGIREQTMVGKHD